ncbi:SIMPL domain-containing protein [Sphingomonas sp.]|uniref:SIMPL domain-containing protein n=1 Tax=Sphingomonas sp. TaxID=28214 RepID=UPI003B3B8DFE
MIRTSALPLFLILAGLSACGRDDPDPRGLRRGETLLSISATGKAEAAPDQAMFTAGMSSIGANAKEAAAGNAQVMNRITAALAKLNIAERDIQTRNISLSRIDYGKNRGKYEASNMIVVRVRDIKRAGQAIGDVTAAGANIVSGPDLSVADPEKANLGAYANAFRAAQAKAQAYAAAANLKIVRVLSIRDGGEGGVMPQMGDVAAREFASPMVQRAAAPPVMAGTNSNIVTTSIDFVLAPADKK